MYFRRLHWSLAVLLLAVVSLPAQEQKPAGWAEWEKISPEGEEFSVLMPKTPTTETGKFAYHKMDLTTRLYLASIPGGPVVAVASFSGIKSDPAAYSDFERFNSYIDAFKDFFPAKVRTKETPTKLTLVSSRPFHGHTGRSYKLTIGDLSGVVHAYATRKRFYAIVSLNTKKDDALEEKFLSSFELPERKQQKPKTTATVEAEENATTAAADEQATSDRKRAGQTEGEAARASGTTEENTESGNVAANSQVPTPTQPNQKRGPISGGMLNGKAIYLPMPEVPPGDASGVVLIQVLIDEQGTVVDARAVSGPQHLHGAALNAARLARFSPTMLMGEPVKVTGTLSYNFVRAN